MTSDASEGLMPFVFTFLVIIEYELRCSKMQPA